MSFRSAVIFGIFCAMSWFAAANDDSTGLVLQNGKVFKVHTVDKGQGLYAVARRYKTDVKAIQEANPGSEKGLVTGQLLWVPTFKTEAEFFGSKTPVYTKFRGEFSKQPRPVTPEKDKPVRAHEEPDASKTSFSNYYTVKRGETLFIIARKFNTSVDFLMQLNKLTTDRIETGRDILVPVNESLSPEAQVAAVEETETADTSVEESTEATPAPRDISAVKYVVRVEQVPEYNIQKVNESGLGKLNADKKFDHSKDWVYHHSAPENTIIRITNPVNNKSIYAKVVKNFERSESDPMIIHLSRHTIEYLELSKKAPFEIELSFTK